ncbi:sensor histidine kinase [Taibaiella chishuiensis]|uniref:histidine kinase n=1 Tax=Taibaiella chishuiensis TaxID=1434707 RepID=A0A2P8D648_9BACT|nr:ATP-binding protein [Taibaiella chishuiensis]PSK92706.1 two-component system phosphate regulon sensor histidine kinase PhoR [Taibaiella chishuiensis]
MSVIQSKNTSPARLSIFTASVLAAISLVFVLFLRQPWYIDVAAFAVTFISAYFIFFYTLQHFIYRKIKLIYKFIYQTKATKREEFFYQNILPQKSIDEVSQEVRRWALEQRGEIELLQKNEQFRKEFLMNLAHELRTPIFTVQGYVHTLLNGAIDDASVNRKFLSNATKGIQRLVQLADDLDQISKLESGKIPIIQESFVVQELIRDVYEELMLKARERNITLQIKKGTESPITVYADKQKIKQVMVNLVENALKYGNDGGTVTAGFYQMDEGHVYVEVSDDGPGIAEQHLPRIFERFYRADRSRSREIGGTGLGLAIVKHIVEAHGQTVNVRSKLGVGSSFGFTLDKGKS